MAPKLPTVLEGIVAARRGHLAGIRERIAHVDPAQLPKSKRSLFASLGGPGGRGGHRFIMECKSSSPSLGTIRRDYHPGDIARIYSRYASGISVLCEPERFGGDYDHLATVSASTHLPVLCKDFIVDPLQVHAARHFGADAILLMLSVLEDADYSALAAEADRLGMDVLTEVIDEEEVERAIRLRARIFGINHRNLHDLSIDLSRSQRLARHIPSEAVVIAESGIRDNATVRDLGGPVNGFLVGSQLTGTPDVDRAARELVFGPNKVCGITDPRVAQTARAAGAVYGGLIFEGSSPRSVSRETAREIREAEPHLSWVAVSRRTSGWGEISQGCAAVQIHSPHQGSVEAERALIRRVRDEVGEGIEVWRAVSMTRPDGPRLASALVQLADRLVLDSGDGGTGAAFQWDAIPAEVRSHSLLAGGIGPDNAAQAMPVGCAGLDINSGVERSGRKDTALIREVFTTIRSYHRTSEERHTHDG